MPRVSLDEMRERIKQGWNFGEAVMGKGWQTKYPNIASWKGGWSLSRRDGRETITLQASCGTVSHRTNYILAISEVSCSSEQDIHQIVDDMMKTWNEQYAEEERLQLNAGWMNDESWSIRYPNIAKWFNRGQRYKTSIKFNLVTHEAVVKAWIINRKSTMETVILETVLTCISEHEVLQMLDETLEAWTLQY